MMPQTSSRKQVGSPLVDGQTAIAEALRAMDAERSELERRREIALPLKQGMMQELLTEGTRLA